MSTATESAGATPGHAGIKMIVFKELKAGDLLKFRAQSNHSGTGGGARDLRFRPHDEFDTAFARLFPTVERMSGKDVRTGQVSWYEASRTRSQGAEYWPPTDARPGEGRWAKVHTFPPFQAAIPEDEGRMVVLLIQDANDKVWLRIETERELRSAAWDQKVIDQIFACVDSKDRDDRSAQGFIDFVRTRSFCHAG